MQAKQLFLALGSNIGDRPLHLQQAVQRLQEEGIQVRRCSSIYETEPQDVADQPWFLNMATECGCTFFPLQLLAILRRIERDLGRRRTGTVPRGPRVIDLDILLYGALSLQTPELTIPHPRMLQRRFVLEPLIEIAPDLCLPRTNERLAKYLKRVGGQAVKRVGPFTALPA